MKDGGTIGGRHTRPDVSFDNDISMVEQRDDRFLLDLGGLFTSGTFQTTNNIGNEAHGLERLERAIPFRSAHVISWTQNGQMR
ncbi:hypothetical protein BVRB_021800 [Beta vulgaris subsp. vulgaris]|uniref:Uncharacterized protein n=1 Tax=Beta vulgaris subsp. vulgaris TaxID=3555 RepID=A0A0J8B064_BETVV|nr:hypothetical protein BVRB_021800 [Beta vulgaris subsp. vulgaris]